MAEKFRFFKGKKFVQDGEEYDSKAKASSVKKEYAEKGFEVEMCCEDGKVLLYTRRVVTEIVLE